MRAIKSWTMFEAMKYQVETYPGDVGNLHNLYNLIAGKEGEDNANFWRRECMSDYNEHLEEEQKLQMWIVDRTYNNWMLPNKTVAVVGDRATAKAIARHHYKVERPYGTRRDNFSVYPEPRRWV